MDRLVIPQALAQAARLEGREEWLIPRPGVIRQAASQWCLTVGEPYQPGGHTAWVAPARGASGERLVLKVAWWHTEAADEAAGLLHRLWIEPPPGHRFRPLQQMCDEWADQFEQGAAAGNVPGDPGLARAGIAQFRELPATAERNVMLCTDLHAGNVLAAQREPWLVVDPKPYAGDPTYDVLRHMLNCGQRLAADPRSFARQMADLLGLDPQRLFLWLFARCIQESAGGPAWPMSHAASPPAKPPQRSEAPRPGQIPNRTLGNPIGCVSTGLIGVAAVVGVRTVVCGGSALTGRIGRHSTARLTVVAAATLVPAQLDQGIGRSHPCLRCE